ncbi:MAG: 7-carboxy-7-deazaguanine synthase QueE [Bacteroidales bacterium]|nr:7-carboxy-7-deazaguanine synthase QueE [Bacteroidales bacterium]MDY6347117.1 7-carboxy-7-deazaguanine synthase QueE [Bacteroidales bacterium]
MNKAGKQRIPVVEEFYSLQGEGFNTGRPAWFVRVGGCEVGCSFCDEMRAWDASRYPDVEIDDIVARAAACPAKAVVVTGGEPLLYDMSYLCDSLRKAGVKRFLETSGSQPLTGEWDWICLSPKYGATPNEELYDKADELKVVVGSAEDFVWAELNAAKVHDKCHLFLQPDWNRCNVVIKEIVDYILKNPKWRMSLQTHKYIQIL